MVNCGTGRNIIADYAKFLVETRGSDTKINTYVKDYALNIIKGAAKMHNLEYNISMAGEANSLDSDEALMNIIREAGKEVGVRPAPENKLMVGASEDVSYMMTKVQENGGLASFMWMMTPLEAEVHNVVYYDFDEQIIPKAISVFVAAAYRVMKDN